MNNNENLKRHQFSFNLAGLQTYTDEVGGQLVMEAVVKAKTARIGYVQSGIKGSQSLNLLTSNLQVQQGNCGWSPSGTTTFSQRNIEVCSYRVNEALCPEQLNQYWLGQFLNAGSYNEQVPFEETIAKLKTEQVQKFVEDTLWKATTGGTDCFQGFYYIFGTGATEPVNFVVSPITAFTSSNMLSIVDQVITALPDKVQEDDDLVVMMSMANYRLYTIGLRNANYYNFGAETREAGTEFITYHPGTNIEVVGIPGMVGTNQVVCGKKSQLIIGTDLMSDSERMEIFYDKNDDEVRVRCNFKIGAQIPFPSNWVSNGLS
jgi:hypothetical protein